jgi:hypothetical protein
MANQHRLSTLLIGLAALVITCPLTACKQPSVPTDQDIIKAYQDNKTEYGSVVKQLMAEANQKFIVSRAKSVTFEGSDKTPVSDATSAASEQIMRRTFCLGSRRNGGLAQFVFFENNAPDNFRSKSLLYDTNDFADPIWSVKGTDTNNARYVWIEPHWRVEYKYEKKGH